MPYLGLLRRLTLTLLHSDLEGANSRRARSYPATEAAEYELTSTVLHPGL